MSKKLQRKTLTWVKIKALKLDVRHYKIAEELGMSSGNFTQIINGYKKIPEGFEDKVKEYFKNIK